MCKKKEDDIFFLVLKIQIFTRKVVLRMKELFEELNLEEMEELSGNGIGKAQCAALWIQCASGGTIGCGGGGPYACQSWKQLCN